VPLACGNTVVFKASELCPLTHQLVVEVLRSAGVPDGALGIVHNREEQAAEIVDTLIGHPAVRRVNFTGSTRVGRLVAELCARHLKKCLLELGGKAPFIVLDDADVDAAVAAAAFGAFFHQGQICMSTERLIVHESLAAEFTDKLHGRAERLAVADGERLGPMISEAAAARVKALVDDAVTRGAKLVAGGKQKGAFLEATILDGISPDMRIYYEEAFGPVASIIRYADVEEAVSIANDTEYGLAAAIFGRDVVRALAVARQIESGICHINGATIHDEPQMPFGGMKASGWGRFGGRAGVEEFTELRWITIQNGERSYPL
jgi:acyl-CoA reductase-like NAD-dependent aldehyde dehydrogenase